MKASELIGCDVVASDGERMGRVFELLADRSGPVVSELQGGALEVCELLVGPSASLLRLGYKSRAIKGPHGLRFIQNRLRGYRVPWERIESIEPGRVLLDCDKDEVETLG